MFSYVIKTGNKVRFLNKTAVLSGRFPLSCRANGTEVPFVLLPKVL